MLFEFTGLCSTKQIRSVIADKDTEKCNNSRLVVIQRIVHNHRNISKTKQKWFKETRHTKSSVWCLIFTWFVKSLEKCLLIHIAMTRNDWSFSIHHIAFHMLSNVLIIIKTYFNANLSWFLLILCFVSCMQYFAKFYETFYHVLWISDLKINHANDFNRIFKIYNCNVTWNVIANIYNDNYIN